MYLCRAFERPSKPLKGSKLRRTSNLTFLKTGLTYWKTVIAFVLGNHRIRDKYVRKILLHIQNKSIKFTYGERKKERPNFYRMFSQNFPISAAHKKSFSYVRWKPRNEQLAQMDSFHQSKRSDNKQYAVEARWGIFFENLTYFFIP